MTENINFITYPEMLEQLETTNLENHLLLGNGFNLSLGIKTGYKDIFQQMKINNSDYKSVMEKILIWKILSVSVKNKFLHKIILITNL